MTKSTFGDHPRRRRNFKVEYARRVERALAKGKTLSQARGHARAGERQKSLTVALIKPTVPEEQAIKLMTKGGHPEGGGVGGEGASGAATAIPEGEHVPPAGRGRRWEIVDSRARQMPMVFQGSFRSPRVSHFRRPHAPGRLTMMSVAICRPAMKRSSNRTAARESGTSTATCILLRLTAMSSTSSITLASSHSRNSIRSWLRSGCYG